MIDPPHCSSETAPLGYTDQSQQQQQTKRCAAAPWCQPRPQQQQQQHKGAPDGGHHPPPPQWQQQLHSADCSSSKRPATAAGGGWWPKGAATPPAQQPITLAFGDAALELSFRAHNNERRWSLDKQAASVYLWMVAFGSALYALIAAFLPAVRPAAVDHCTRLIICSWAGPAMHLLLLRCLPRATYVAHRTPIILALRACYIAFGSDGFAQCGMVPLQEAAGASGAQLMPLQPLQQPAAAAAGAVPGGGGGGGTCPMESAFSAVLWRSGIIGLVWWGAAFPLLWGHHMLLQGASVLLYVRALTPVVCATIHNVRWGGAVLAGVAAAGHTVASHLAAAVGAPGLAAAYADKATAALATSSRSGSDGSGAGLGSSSCMHSLAFLQLVLGFALPSFVMFCWEARRRNSWWREQLHAQQAAAASAASSRAGSPRSDAHSAAAAGGDGDDAAGVPQAGWQQERVAAAAGAAATSSRQLPQDASDGTAPTDGVDAGAGAVWADADGDAEFDAECGEGAQPPSIREVLVLLVVIGLCWTLLGEWLPAV